jgi:hypothetical protein
MVWYGMKQKQNEAKNKGEEMALALHSTFNIQQASAGLCRLAVL